MKIRGTVSQLLQRGQGFYYLHRFNADSDNSLHEVYNVARVSLFFTPVVRVIHDATVLIYGDGVAFHQPLNCGLAIDNVFVGFIRDFRERTGIIVDDGVTDAFLGETHLGHSEVTMTFLLDRPRLNCLVVQMEFCQLTACLGECPEILGKGNAEKWNMLTQ